MYSPWTRHEKHDIVVTYRRMHLARCPNDRALLTVTAADTGQTPDERDGDHVLRFQCPNCQRRFFSDEVEPDPDPEAS